VDPKYSLISINFYSQSHNDLNYLTHCEFAYHLKKDEICINPYHYTKLEPGSNVSPSHQQQDQQPLSVLVPKFPPSTSESSSVSYLDHLNNPVPLNLQYNDLK
jgi:mothers against decapentaplegic homolog 3